jgi:hypothetical protein
MASCNLIGPIDYCILQIVESVFVVSVVESELHLPDEETEVALKAAVVRF